ncbi:MAG: tetratricopeptide repeat protein [Bacteroidia bacterium]|nr:tetratricopeptide repeat protein [Bacteroidia bacterium]
MDNSAQYDNWLSQGLQFAEEGKLAEAQQAFEQAVEVNPEGFEVYANLGALAQLGGDHPRALAYLDQALAIEETHTHSHYNRGISLAAMTRYEEALEAYDKVMELDPGYFRVYMAKGYSLMQLKEEKQAKQLFESFLQMSGPEESTLREQVDIWLKALNEGETEEGHYELLRHAQKAMEEEDGLTALKFFEQYLKIYPSDHLVLVQKAYVLAMLNRREEAMEASRLAEKLSPEEPWVYYFQAKVEKVFGRPEAAMRLIARAEQLNPELSDVYTFKAELTEDEKERFQFLSKAITLHPETATPYYERGLIFLGRGEMLEALSDFSHGLGMAPEKPEYYQKIEDILGYLEDQIKKNATDPTFLATRAQAYMRLERFEDALSDWQAALKIQPDNILLIRGLIESLVSSGQTKRAWETITRHLEREGPEVNLLVDRAQLSMLQMRNEEAEKDLDDALKLEPQNGEAHHFKGMILASREGGAEAERYFLKALELGFESPDLFRQLGLREIEKSDLEKSLEYFQKGIAMGINVEILLDAAYVANALGENKLGLEFLDTLLTHFPNVIEAWKLRGSLQEALGQYQNAIYSYDSIRKLNPFDLEAIYSSMLMAYQVKNWSLALSCASKLFSSQAEDPQTLKIRGLAYYQLGKQELAKRDLLFYLQGEMDLEALAIQSEEVQTDLLKQEIFTEEELQICIELAELKVPKKKKKKAWWKR